MQKSQNEALFEGFRAGLGLLLVLDIEGFGMSAAMGGSDDLEAPSSFCDLSPAIDPL
jgi:hypothetical protein